MDWADVKVLRAEAIQSMKDHLDEAEPLDMPLVAIVLLMTPVFLLLIVYGLLRILFGTVAGILGNALKMIAAPFLGAYLWFDMTLIAFWFFCRLCKKFAGEK